MGLFGLFGKSKKQQATNILVEEYQHINQSFKQEPFQGIITFLNATSRLQDNLEAIRAIIPKKDEQAQNAFRIFEGIIKEAGRDRYTNRTQPGEEVTMFNVYLGGNTGNAWTFTIYQWITEKKEHKAKGEKIARDFLRSYENLPDTMRELFKALNIQI